MPQEIERKYLLSAKPEGLHQGEEILQGYLATGDPEIRVRCKGNKCFATKKEGEGLVRTEGEAEITKEVFLILWPGTYGARVEKIRYTLVADDGLTWEVDEYTGQLAGLFIAEVELADASLNPVMPASIKAVLVREVTGDPDYMNQRLAEYGLP